MNDEQNPASSHRAVRLAEKFHNKEYRDAYVESYNRRFLAHQMRDLRGEQSQADFGEQIGKSQTIVWRLEDPNYSGWTFRTLFEIARKLNLAVITRLVDFPTFLNLTSDQSETALRPTSYKAEVVDQNAYAIAAQEQPYSFPQNYGLSPDDEVGGLYIGNSFLNFSGMSGAGALQPFGSWANTNLAPPVGRGWSNDLNALQFRSVLVDLAPPDDRKGEVAYLKAQVAKLEAALLACARSDQRAAQDQAAFRASSIGTSINQETPWAGAA